MASILVQGITVYISSVVVWKLIKNYVVKSPLDIVPGPPPASLITGHVKDLFHADAWKYHDEILRKYGSVMMVKGLLGERQLIIFDPQALHHILVKDQYIYEESESFTLSSKLLFGEGLLSTLGEQHRKQRKMLNPVFSIAHMREMTPIFYDVTSRLRKAIYNQVKTSPKEIDVLHWMTRTALELIGQSGMGYSFDSLESSQKADLHPYSRSVKRLGGFLAGPLAAVLASYAIPIVHKFNFPRFKRWVVDHWPSKWVQDIKDITDVMHETALDIYKTKRQAMEEGHGDDGKKDIISILMRANESATEEDRLTDEELYGQVATLTFAAMDTTSSALSRILLLLADHQDVQDKLRAELIEAKKNNGDQELGYDKLVSLPYLDAVCRETLRVFPPLANAIRIARKDMILPLSKPLQTTTKQQVTDLFIPNGTTIHVSIIGANRNPDMWGTDAKEWKPERWLNPLPDKVAEAHMPGIYSHLMTFLGGSRACIGFKFSQLEMKVVLSILLTSFKFSRTHQTIKWKMSGISTPIVEGDDYSNSTMPLKVTLLE
ncbi:hypothetical protein Agabi119p4_7527 [Agaricus bisporus var. burnettii]|uniref:Cytochrome P450 n=1 Tax=Agaricus bisporus var. burnettii TaxID=192524 RepID=A0A8H7C969_AGABI|nr:hypothetical protein Agabi119p4_7527 [Agaricus bisporus var. burnettii]